VELLCSTAEAADEGFVLSLRLPKRRPRWAYSV